MFPSAGLKKCVRLSHAEAETFYEHVDSLRVSTLGLESFNCVTQSAIQSRYSSLGSTATTDKSNGLLERTTMSLPPPPEAQCGS